MSSLRIDDISRDGARFACEHWHYAKKLPPTDLIMFGAWEDGMFIGAVIFGRGASPYYHNLLKVRRGETGELLRVALGPHRCPTSKVVACAMRRLRITHPHVRALVSFADQAQGHLGVLYQALNWFYFGETKSFPTFSVQGQWKHLRTVSIAGRPLGEVAKRMQLPKHRYVYALDPSLRESYRALAQPYPRPKRATSGDHPDSGGSTPTRALHHVEKP